MLTMAHGLTMLTMAHDGSRCSRCRLQARLHDGGRCSRWLTMFTMAQDSLRHASKRLQDSKIGTLGRLEAAQSAPPTGLSQGPNALVSRAASSRAAATSRPPRDKTPRTWILEARPLERSGEEEEDDDWIGLALLGKASPTANCQQYENEQ